MFLNSEVPVSLEESSDFPEEILQTDDGSYVCSYHGTKRKYSVFPPDGEVQGIIFMLHGYGSDGGAFRLLTRMDEPANAKRYAVVYVDGTATPEDRTSSAGWNSGIGVSSSDDMKFLNALAEQFQKKYNLTKEQTYAAGFSNGGFMMYRIALEGQERFAAVASVAGMMPRTMWNRRNDLSCVSLLQINGTKDDAVPMLCNGSADYSEAPAIENVIAWFAEAYRLNEVISESLSDSAVLTKYRSNREKPQVWQVLIRNGRHSWPQQKYCGFDVNALILDFFDSV